MKAIIGKKIGMTQVFTVDGKMTAVTAIQAEPNIVLGHRTADKEGYQAAILGFGTAKKLTKPMIGQLKMAGVESVKVIKEFKTDELPEVASTVDVAVFTPGDKVDVSSVGKGKGFAGVIKRHHFSRGPETHGSDHHRAPGSIGSAFPQRVVKGRRLPGHLGSNQVTVKKLEVIEVHPDKHLLLIKGAIPGSKGTVVAVRGHVNA